MRARALLSAFFLFFLSRALYSETTVDVSKEWAAHMSSSAAADLERFSAPVKPSTAAASVAVEPVCQCDAMTVQERLEDATYAFTGMVAEAPAPKKGVRTATFDVDEIFKGSPNLELKVTSEVTGDSCDLPFEEGQNYLVYAKWEWGNVITASCMGTKLLAKAKNELGPSQSLKDKLYIRLHNACMGRLDTACCLASLKAMRVGYNVPEPEDGCPDGTVPDRLHCGGSYIWCVSPTEKTHE